MGLDQYVYSTNKDAYLTETNFVVGYDESTKFAYWRKNYSLNNYMLQLFLSKGGTSDFNQSNMNLTLEDIKNLETVVLNMELYDNGYPYSIDYREYDLEFCTNAINELDSGRKLYYHPWW